MKLEISSKDTTASVKLDGLEISGIAVGYSLSQKACERPVFTVEFAPDEVEIDADDICVLEKEGNSENE